MPISPWSYSWKPFEFGDSLVYVRSMTLGEALEFEKNSANSPTAAMIAIIVACCVDHDRLPLTAERVMALPVDRVGLIAQRIVEISKPPSAETLAKN
ncbi:MAG: hypothetical protein EBR82_23565 [Caulobacteraceae bacterium]|nr:hypothetical protein [Caulobacteraceae bacterium]